MTNQMDLRVRIEAAAERLGASRASVFKWRSRGIPNKWKIRLVEDGQGEFSLADLGAFRAGYKGVDRASSAIAAGATATLPREAAK